jgi:maleylacetoacetate isomerase/maleylpyruvate isomerase
MKFYSFWRSQASLRVRIALNLKGLPTEVIFVDLDADAHRADEFRRLNPQMALPALVDDDGTTLVQSLAIIEYLEETHPAPPLLPKDARGRARVRALALMVACEGHPLLVPRVRRYLDHEPTLADICLFGHVTVAVMQQINLAPYPTAQRIFETMMTLPAFATAHPLRQPDTPEAMRPKAI